MAGDAAFFAGLALACVVVLWTAARVQFLFFRWIRPRLSRKILRVDGVDVGDAPMVGIAPGRDVLLYNGDTSWDVGFLLLLPGRMRYLGDRSTFELRPEQVRSVDTSRAMSLCGYKVPRMILVWKPSPSEKEQEMSVELGGGNNRKQMRALLEDLARHIEEWRAGPGPSSETTSDIGSPPTVAGVLGPKAQYMRSPGCVAVGAAALVGIALCTDLMLWGFRHVSEFSRWRSIFPIGVAVIAVVVILWLARRFQSVLDPREGPR